MTAPETTYVVDSPSRAREILREMEGRFRTKRQVGGTDRRIYFDTFDWRIHKHGGTLSAVPADNGSWSLGWRERSGRIRHRTRTATIPEFAARLEARDFRRALLKVAEMRRLLPAVRVETRRETLCLLDRRKKTVARVHLERGSARVEDRSTAKRMPVRLRLAPVRGYERARDSVARFLEEQLRLPALEGGELSLALAAVGRRPGSYSSKIRLELSPATPAAAAAKQVLTSLLETMLANEDGTRKDLDSEFLHDFRVAVRRTRSLLGQVKGIFHPATTAKYRREFAWLGKITGPTRDMDVYRLKIDDYRALLPEDLARELQPLVAHLELRQQEEQARLARELESKRYRQLVRDWSRFLRREPGRSGPRNASRPIGEVANERIARIYKRVSKTGRSLTESSPADTVHQLRIDCKKLRYLLEFFRSLYDGERIADFLRALKRLQDYLGDFNDYEVQQNELRRMADEMLGRDGGDAPTLLAMGRLVDWLGERQAELKAPLLAEVHRFVSKKNRAKFAGLLA